MDTGNLQPPDSTGFIDIEIEMENLKLEFLLNDCFKKGSELGGNFMHSHSWFELHIITESPMNIQTKEQKYNLQPRDLLIIPPFTEHKILTASDGIQFVFGINISDNGKEFNENLYNMISSFFNRLQCTHIKNQTELVKIANDLYKDLFERDIGLLYRLKMHLTRLLFNLYDNLSVITVGNVFKNDLSPDKIDKYKNTNMRTYFIDSYMSEHFRENITLEDLAGKIFLSTKQLNRIIKKQYNQTFYQRLTSLRLNEAKKLLRETNLSVEEIAYFVGYSTHTGFYKAFKQYTGMIPSEYRLSRNL